ncbi:26S proteasome non-ATPase regulatory subunit 4-like [Oppia nitens]|uniref:26S proteasome non-ATPase regulatory subunit 4-like n=1 Tax=Oppia nitens TaxID=1686743 RepID=UPI0023DA6680|nr:26S proteasome non-ATPase regulatory subunit 4-like [Oppia nitens]
MSQLCVLCLDNSHFMVNEDLLPSRLAVQREAANALIHQILSSNAESRVAILQLAPNAKPVRTLTTDEVLLMRALYGVSADGQLRFTRGLEIALLVLKNAPQSETTVRKRVLAFVGSPVSEEDIKQLPSTARKLRRANVSIDIVSFGPEAETDRQKQVLREFLSQMTCDSHLVCVPKDNDMNYFLSTSILFSNAVSLVNERTDPEIAIAVKQSAAEHNTRLDAEMKRAIQESEKSSGIKTESKNSTKETEKNEQTVLSEEEQLALALQLSLLETQIKKSDKKQ